MIINGCGMNYRAYKPLSCNSSWPRPAPLPAKSALTNIRGLFQSCEGFKLHRLTGMQIYSSFPIFSLF